MYLCMYICQSKLLLERMLTRPDEPLRIVLWLLRQVRLLVLGHPTQSGETAAMGSSG